LSFPVGRGQNPEIRVRYSTKQLVQIFKGLGRFQSPLEQSEAYKLELASSSEGARERGESDTSSGSDQSLKVKEILKSLMHAKPVVVLEHLKSAKALPLSTQSHLKEKILQSVTTQLSQVKIGLD